VSNRRSRRWKTCRSIQGSIMVLIQFRALVAELVFTVAAIYGLFHVLVLLIR